MRFFPGVLAIFTVMAFLPTARAQTLGGITRELWTGVPGTDVARLTELPTFPHQPDSSTLLNSLEAPQNSGFHYGTRIRGFLHPPLSGEYRFWIAGDDECQLWISPDADPAKKRLVARVPQWTLFRQWDKFAEQASAPMVLQAGQRVYIEVLHKEDTGNDSVSVAWRVPGGSGQTVIPGSVLSPMEPLPPVALDDTVWLPPGGTAALPSPGNDYDPNGAEDLSPSHLAIVDPPAQGVASVDPAGPFLRYTHTGTGNDTFSYTLTDKTGRTSAKAWVDVRVSEDARLPATLLSLPVESPPSAYRLDNAFPGLSFDQPLALATPPGETNRLFVVERSGRIRVIPDLTAPSAATFLDLSAIVGLETGEEGLLGLAFHPEYAVNGYFYVFYTINGPRFNRLSRFQVSAGNPNLADAASETVFLHQRDEASNHNAGDIHFGPDGYLYISTGDEGGGNDQLNNSQRIDKDYFSGILRIDVDRKPGNPDPNPHPAVMTDGSGTPYYAVPHDNPWIGATSFNGIAVDPLRVIQEFYAVGLRNAWRMSFDPLTGELWAGDVGQTAREEINLIRKGGNYGWAFREGFLAGPKAAPPGVVADDPIWDYPRSEGFSVTGGIVYRGSRFPELFGAYLFADYLSGNVWTLRNDGATPEVARIVLEGGIAAFGRDPANGDVLLADLGEGLIYRLEQGDPASAVRTLPPTLAATGAFADPITLTPNPGLVPYDIRVPFWSDHARKQRWFALPDATNTVGFSVDAPWTIPPGTVFVKHFDLDLERGNTNTATRVETRFLVKTADAAYGVSYAWNPAGTEATLVPFEGSNRVVQVTVNGSPSNQVWRIPGRAECMACHTPQAGYALSFNTRQLNRDGRLFGLPGQQLADLSGAGYLDTDVASPDLLPRHAAWDDTEQSLTHRVRSYLAVNCVSCHLPGGSAPGSFDVRPQLTLEQSGLIDGVLNNPGGDPENRLVVRGDPGRSVLLARMSACCGFGQMPPLGSTEPDRESIARVLEWIQGEAAQYQTYAEWAAERFGTPLPPNSGKSEDADDDSADNHFEYLTGTDPTDGEDVWRFGFIAAEGMGALEFLKAPQSGYQADWSSNLVDWVAWDVPGNATVYAGSNRLDRIEGPLPSDRDGLFFRLRVWER